MTDVVSEIDSHAPQADQTRGWPRWAGPVAGLAAGAVAVTVGMLVAAIVDVVSPIDAVGSEVIDRVPKWLKTLAIDWFGTNDKTALRVGIITILAIAATVFGHLAARRFRSGVAGFAVFALVGALAGLHRPNQPGSAVVAPVIGALAGVAVLAAVLRRRPVAAQIPGRSRVPLGWDRRRFLSATAAGAAGAVVAGGAARAIDRRRLDDVRNSAPAAIPPAAEPASTAPVAPGADGNPGGVPELTAITPYITPNGDYYRIDTALSFPRANLDTWKVTIGGMVDTPISLTYNDLLARPLVERTITLCCVSNEVGGDLIGNATWKGVLLADLLREAGVKPGAEQVYSTSLDGWTCGFPVEVALDGRDAMIAVAMNGEPLPIMHGFPARLVVPGVYGYVSATKWLDKIELTTWAAEEGYWVPRGWARDAPVKTESRIDVPRRGDKVVAGTTAIAGIAWAQHRGIAKVEVGIDGVWAEARLSDDLTDDSWRQWVYEWDAKPGKYVVQVRATDKTGATQTEDVARVDPDGATGWHTRRITVSA